MATACERQDQWRVALTLLDSEVTTEFLGDESWRLAKLSQLRERPKSWNLEPASDLEDMSFSKLVVRMWAAASLSAGARESSQLCWEAMCRLTRGDASHLSIDNIAKLAWSISMLPPCSATPVALHHLQRELAHRAQRLRYATESGEGHGFVQTFLDEALTVLWSSSFAGFLSDAAAHSVWNLQSATDRIHPVEWLEGVPDPSRSRIGEAYVVQLLPEQLVIFKPPGWEVDYAPAAGLAEGVLRSKLSDFIRAWLTPRQFRCRQKLQQIQAFCLPIYWLMMVDAIYLDLKASPQRDGLVDPWRPKEWFFASPGRSEFRSYFGRQWQEGLRRSQDADGHWQSQERTFG